MFTKEQARFIAKKLGVRFDKFPFEDFYTGLNIELEHGRISPATNVTNDDLEMTAKIALAHLNEFADYYNKDYGLPVFEAQLEKRKQKKRQHHNQQRNAESVSSSPGKWREVIQSHRVG